MALHLSRVRGERQLQRYVLAYFAVVAVAGAALVGYQIWAYSRLGATATREQLSDFFRLHGLGVIRLVLGGVMSLVMLVFPVLAVRQRDQLRSVRGLRGRWVLAGVLLGGFAIPMLAWPGVAVHLLTVVWLLTVKPDTRPATGIEGGSFG